jgi:enamine deaminase RidA (YjgF/YER057c/UK114 family)
MLDMLNPAGVPASPVYSHGALATNAQKVLYVSGQVGVDASGNVGADIAAQTRLAIANVGAVLAEAGMDASNIAKLTIYLTDGALIPGFMAAAGGPVSNPPPATTMLIVKALATPELLIEIEAIAVA